MTCLENTRMLSAYWPVWIEELKKKLSANAIRDTASKCGGVLSLAINLLPTKTKNFTELRKLSEMFGKCLARSSAGCFADIHVIWCICTVAYINYETHVLLTYTNYGACIYSDTDVLWHTCTMAHLYCGTHVLWYICTMAYMYYGTHALSHTCAVAFNMYAWFTELWHTCTVAYMNYETHVVWHTCTMPHMYCGTHVPWRTYTMPHMYYGTGSGSWHRE